MSLLLGSFCQDEHFKAVSPGSNSCPATTLCSVVRAGAGECNARPWFCACLPCIGCGGCPGCCHQCIPLPFCPPTHLAICFGMLVCLYWGLRQSCYTTPKVITGLARLGLAMGEKEPVTCVAVCLQESPNNAAEVYAETPQLEMTPASLEAVAPV